MIVLFTDFGAADPYVGQVHAVLARAAPHARVIDLLHMVPNFDIRSGAYLLPALTAGFPTGTVFVGVIDPGVGGGRLPIMVQADARWYVGPDNGLFQIVARRARRCETWAVTWRPQSLSASFHGRDLFAPVAARLARGDWPTSVPATLTVPNGDWPDDLSAIVYIDHYGNAITGLRAAQINAAGTLAVAGRQLQHAPVFSAVAPNMPFWYANSVGLVEIAVNHGDAAGTLGLKIGDPVQVIA